MNKLKKVVAMLMCTIMLMSTMNFSVFAQDSAKQLDVLFTHDTHSHVLPNKEYENGNISERGGYARLETALKEKRAKNANTITVDAGDFTVGSLFQTLYSTQAAELCLLGAMDYDVVTAGNHEFDFGDESFADMLSAAKSSGNKLPQFVMSNYTIPTDENGNYDELGQKIESSINDYGVKEYTIIQKGDVKIAVFGLLGDSASSDIQTAEMQFQDIEQSAQNTVNDIKTNEPDTDMIICLSHSGTNSNEKKSEDENLAKAVPDIDVIVSGHTHTTLDQPIKIGDTYIVSAGCYTENLGELKLIQDNTTKRWDLLDYNLTPITSDLEDDEDISYMIESYKPLIQQEYLDRFGYTYDQVLSYSPFNFTNINDIGKEVKEEPLGDLISDSYRYAYKKATGDTADMAVVPQGTMRASFTQGDITTSDVFNTNSLGIGADDVQTYPLVKIYLKGSDLKTACEIDASVSKLMPEASLFFSGLSYAYNPNRMLLDKVTDVKIDNADGTQQDIEDDKMYSCIVGWYTVQMLSSVKDLSFGIINIPLYDENGNEITDPTFSEQVLTQDGKEIKEWQATAEYLSSFDEVNGVPQIPDYYNTTHNRKVQDNTNNLSAILSNPSTSTIIVLVALLVALAIVILIVVLITKLIKRNTAKKLQD